LPPLLRESGGKPLFLTCSIVWFWFYSTTFNQLKIHLECKLDHSWTSTRRRYLSKRRRHGDVVVRIVEVGPVEQVEKLRAKLASDRFRNRNELDDREIHVLLTWTIEEVARRVAKRIIRIERRAAQRRARKCRRIEKPTEPRLRAAVGLDTARKSGREVSTLDNVVTDNLDYRKRSSCLQRQNPVELPVVQQPTRRA
jgi:hypothetical protein